MQINTILNEDCTRAKIKVNSKKRVLENLAHIFSEAIPDIEADKLYQSLLNRERLGSTGIGSGIAIPHCRFKTNGKTFGACITLEQPVDFDSVDNEPVDLVFAMLVPENAESAHLEALASLAEVLQQPSFVTELRDAESSNQLFCAATSPGH